MCPLQLSNVLNLIILYCNDSGLPHFDGSPSSRPNEVLLLYLVLYWRHLEHSAETFTSWKRNSICLTVSKKISFTDSAWIWWGRLKLIRKIHLLFVYRMVLFAIVDKLLFGLIVNIPLFLLTMFNTLHENKNFRLTKICEKDRKDHIFISFRMFPFHGNIIFSELSFKRKCKKAASFRKCVFLRKYEIFVYDSCA